MFFERDDLQFELLDVLRFDERDILCRTLPRSHCALSLRRTACTDITFKNQTVRLKSHDLAFFPPKFGYVRRSRQDDMIVFHFNVLQEHFLPTEIEIFPQDRFDLLWPLFEEALREWEDKAAGYRYRATSALLRVFSELQRVNAPIPRYSSLLQRAMAWLENAYTDPETTVLGLASHLHVSETYLRRIFHRELAQSPKQYLNLLRLNRAKALLNAGYDSIGLVAEKSGFRDPKYFATAFKKQFGYPPSKQRYNRV